MAEKRMNLYVACAIGTVILYIVGSAYAYVLLNFFVEGDGLAIDKLVKSFMLLPLPGDIAKIILAAFVGGRVRKALKV